MASQQNGVTGILIAAFVMVILGVSLIGVISQQANAAVAKERTVQAVTIPRNESFSNANYTVNVSKSTAFTNAPTGWKVLDCPISNVLVWNTTIAGVSDGLLTVTTDYTVDAAAGTISFLNSTDLGGNADLGTVYNNLTNVRYDYCADTYLNSGWGRTVLPLVGGFFALALLGVGIALFFQAGKQTGLI